MTKKSIRDPNAPKRNLSAYLLYQNTMRDHFRSLNPGMTFGQLAKYTAAMYAEISQAEKQAWAERAEQDKARYLHELQNYTPPPGYDSKGDAITVTSTSIGGETEHMLPVFPGQQQQFQQQHPHRTKTKSKAETRDPNAPKRNLPPFILYQNAMREQFQKENPGMTFGQLAKYTSHMYKNLTAEEKSTWEARAHEDKIRYEAQMASYTPPPGHNAQGIMMGPNSMNNNAKRRAKRKAKDKDPNAPKRACGAYVFFTNEMRPEVMKEFPGIKFIEMGRILGERWRNLPAEEKKRFEDMASEDKVRFQMEMQQYTAEKNTLEAQQEQAQREQQQQLLSQQQSSHHQYQQYLSQQQQQMLLNQHQLQPQQHVHPVSANHMPSVGSAPSHGHYAIDPYQYQPHSDYYQSFHAERI